MTLYDNYELYEFIRKRLINLYLPCIEASNSEKQTIRDLVKSKNYSNTIIALEIARSCKFENHPNSEPYIKRIKLLEEELNKM